MPYDPSLPFSKFGTAPVSPKDDRDHLIQAYMPSTLSAADLPDEVGSLNVKAYPGIRTQEQEGACTGFAYRGVKGTMERRVRKTASKMKSVPDFGPRGIYTLAKQVGGYPDEEGAYLRDVVKAGALYGSPREKDWPYVPHVSDYGKTQEIGQPAKRWLTYSKPWGIGAYAQARTLENMLVFLEHAGPLFIAMSLTENFFEPDANGVIPEPSGAEVGGHALALIAAKQSTRQFYVANSWGPKWGADGFCWISYDHFMVKSDSEAWAIPDALSK
jgi:Papain family cysteine protease